MKRISFVLLPMLLFAALGPFASSALAAHAKTAQAVATATAIDPDGNDCDHDSGHHPIDDVCTPTPVPTAMSTPTAAACTMEQANFATVPVGASVQGMGAVAPNLNITSLYSAVRVQAGTQPEVYVAGPRQNLLNGGADVRLGAFGDVLAHRMQKPARFIFTFAPGMTVTDFRLHMLDYGDWNPRLQTAHVVMMSAFNAANQLVARQVLSYTTPAVVIPGASNLYGDLQRNGDALGAAPGMPGNWMWHVAGTGITRIVLAVGVGPDPNFALDTLSVKFTCP